MQIILLVAGVFSMVIGQFHTGIMVLILTVINAVVGLREEGKAESAMNALKSMMKATARVRRDGAEAQIPAEQVVAGDTVLLAAGDQVPADGRIVSASALQIDESALTGESVPASKDAQLVSGANLGPGDQTNMAFMNTPVTHGSGVMIVTGTGADTEVGKIAGMLSATKVEQTPLTKQLNRMTLWIGAAALLTMIVMFVLGLQRGQEWSALFVTAIALAIAAIPEALPTVSQVILSMGAMDLAKRNAIVKNLSSVETLGSTSAINSDKTGTLTMNQMTVVEVLDLTDRWEITGTGYSLEGTVKHSAGASPSIDEAILPFLIANDAKLEDGKVVGDPTEGAMLVLAHKAGLSVDATREKFPRLATLPFDPTYKLMATFNDTTDAEGKKVVRCFVKGAAPAVGSRSTCVESGRPVRPRGRRPQAEGGERLAAARRPGAARHGRRLQGRRPRRVQGRRRPARVLHRPAPRQHHRHDRPAAGGVGGGGQERPGRPHPRAHGHRRRRRHRGRRGQAGRHPRRGHPRAPTSPPSARTSASSASTTSAWSAASPPSTRCCSPRRSRRRATWWP